jgi:hypothetical protein
MRGVVDDYKVRDKIGVGWLDFWQQYILTQFISPGYYFFLSYISRFAEKKNIPGKTPARARK